MWKEQDVARTCTKWQVIAACAILKSPTTAKLLNAMNAKSKSTVSAVRHDGQLVTRFCGVAS